MHYMIGKTFMNAVANGKTDILQTFLKILAESRTPYCMISGLCDWSRHILN